MSCALVTGCGGSKTPAAESEAATEAPAEEQEGTDALTEEQTSDEADAQEETEEKTAAAVLEDGTYTAEFDTDSSMFHVNEKNFRECSRMQRMEKLTSSLPKRLPVLPEMY